LEKVENLTCWIYFSICSCNL